MLKEDEFIQKYFAPLSPMAGAHNLQDDVAHITVPPGNKLVVSTDTLVEGVHFFGEDSPKTIAQKALRVNLSDLAAKAARPVAYFLNLCLPPKYGADFMESFVEGLGQDQDEYNLLLFGGDTVRTLGPLTLSITIMGTVSSSLDLARTKAREGDILMMTGTLGDAALGLKLRRNMAVADLWGLSAGDKTYLKQRYLLPQPRMKATKALKNNVRASMDISDGLIADCSRMARASGLKAVLQTDALPLSDAARLAVSKDESVLQAILSGGDDYEILSAVPKDRVKAYQKELQEAGIKAAVIGGLFKGEGGTVELYDSTGEPVSFEETGYSHI